jgi:hypothetical protein
MGKPAGFHLLFSPERLAVLIIATGPSTHHGPFEKSTYAQRSSAASPNQVVKFYNA